MLTKTNNELRRPMSAEKKAEAVKAACLNIFLLVFGILMLTPLLWMLATALSPNTKIPPTGLIPHEFTVENFKKAWFFPSEVTTYSDLTMGTFFLNSLYCTACITIGGIIVDSLAAYVLAFKDFPGKNLFVFLALATLMIPSYVTLVPEYLLVVKLKGTNTYWALIVPFLASGMGISLFRSHFLGLSRELEESAKMDGASDLRVYATIIMPISKPVIGTMTILKAMWSWNQYMWPLIVAKNYDKQTIQVALKLFSGPNMTDWGYLCAGMTMAILPLVIVFLCAQKQFIGGLTAGAVKG